MKASLGLRAFPTDQGRDPAHNQNNYADVPCGEFLRSHCATAHPSHHEQDEDSASDPHDDPKRCHPLSARRYPSSSTDAVVEPPA